MSKKTKKGHRQQGVSGNPAKRAEAESPFARQAASYFDQVTQQHPPKTSPGISPSPMSATMRQQCSECGTGTVRWIGAEEAKQLGHDVDDGLAQLAATGMNIEKVDIWTCERPGCPGFGMLPYDYEIGGF